MKLPPVFLFAFAQHADDPQLEQLRAEERKIREILQAAHDARKIECIFLGAVTQDELYWQINRFHNRLAVFHFGGHSDHQLLALQDEPTRSANLSVVLGMQQQLQLLFLNGCANAPQVQAFWDEGVPAVIATRTTIADDHAVTFSPAFYQALVEGKTIQQSFESASARIADKIGNGDRPAIYRSLSLRGDSTPPFPWGLYVKKEDESAMEWQLPEPFQIPDNMDFYSEVPLSRKDANKLLVKHLFAGMATANRRCANDWEDYNDPNGEVTFNDLQDTIYKRFPSILGVHIRDLFSEDGQEKGRVRLQYMNNVYCVFAQLVTSLALAGFWKAIMEKENLKQAVYIEPAYREDLQSLLDLKPENHGTFDFLRLLTAIHYIGKKNDLNGFFYEMPAFLDTLLKKETVFSAYRFLETELRARLLAANIASEEVSDLCAESEKQLGILLGAGAFLINYQLTSINDIMVRNQLRKAQASFIHRKYVLRGWDETTWDHAPLHRQGFTCDHSVVITPNLKNEEAPLWVLSPFLVDQNAFKARAKTPKIYFWQGTSGNGKSQYLHAETLEEKWEVNLEYNKSEKAEELEEMVNLLDTFLEDLKKLLSS